MTTRRPVSVANMSALARARHAVLDETHAPAAAAARAAAAAAAAAARAAVVAESVAAAAAARVVTTSALATKGDSTASATLPDEIDDPHTPEEAAPVEEKEEDGTEPEEKEEEEETGDPPAAAERLEDPTADMDAEAVAALSAPLLRSALRHKKPSRLSNRMVTRSILRNLMLKGTSPVINPHRPKRVRHVLVPMHISKYTLPHVRVWMETLVALLSNAIREETTALGRRTVRSEDVRRAVHRLTQKNFI